MTSEILEYDQQINVTKPVISRFQDLFVQFFRDTKVGRYSFVHLLLNISAAAWTAFYLVLKFICESLKSPGDKLNDGEPNRKWYDVRASKSSMLLLFGVSGHWLKIDSTSQTKVVNVSSANKRSLVLVLRARFTILTKASQTPPIHELTGRLDFHWMGCLFKVWATSFWSMQVSACFSSFSAPMKLEPISDLNIFTWPCRAMNLRSANMNAVSSKL